jgi:hypothetical protein
VYAQLSPAITLAALDAYPALLSCAVNKTTSAFRHHAYLPECERVGFFTPYMPLPFVIASASRRPMRCRTRVIAPATANIVLVSHYSGQGNRPNARLTLSGMSDLSPVRNPATEEKNEQAQCLGLETDRCALDRHTEDLGAGGLSIDNCE